MAGLRKHEHYVPQLKQRRLRLHPEAEADTTAILDQSQKFIDLLKKAMLILYFLWHIFVFLDTRPIFWWLFRALAFIWQHRRKPRQMLQRIKEKSLNFISGIGDKVHHIVMSIWQHRSKPRQILHLMKEKISNSVSGAGYMIYDFVMGISLGLKQVSMSPSLSTKQFRTLCRDHRESIPGLILGIVIVMICFSTQYNATAKCVYSVTSQAFEWNNTELESLVRMGHFALVFVLLLESEYAVKILVAVTRARPRTISALREVILATLPLMVCSAFLRGVLTAIPQSMPRFVFTEYRYKITLSNKMWIWKIYGTLIGVYEVSLLLKRLESIIWTPSWEKQTRNQLESLNPRYEGEAKQMEGKAGKYERKKANRKERKLQEKKERESEVTEPAKPAGSTEAREVKGQEIEEHETVDHKAIDEGMNGRASSKQEERKKTKKMNKDEKRLGSFLG